MQLLYDNISQHPVVQDWNADMVDWACNPVEGQATIRDRRIMLDMIAGLIPPVMLFLMAFVEEKRVQYVNGPD